jgi:3-oxoacyl-[acyl-carrier protein] reductase
MREGRRVALVTGGRGGLGQALERALCVAGLEVFAPGRRELDVLVPGAAAGYVERLGGLDLLVNNAGMARDAAFLKMTEGEWDEVIGVNLEGAMRVTGECLGALLNSGAGHIVHVGSFAARAGTAGQANYAAAKAGLVAHAQSLAKEHGRAGLRANVVLPGFLETRLSGAAWARGRERVLEQHALGRLNTVEDAARFVAFLDTMSAVSGQVFQLDSRVGRWT